MGEGEGVITEVESYITKQEYLLEAEAIKEDMTEKEKKAFDLGADWLRRYINEVIG